MSKRFTLTMVGVVAIFQPTWAEQPVFNDKLFDSLKADAIDFRETQTEESSAQERTALFKVATQITHDLGTLQGVLDAKEIEPSAEYRANLKQTQEALKRVSRPDSKAADKLRVSRSVAKDLEVKRIIAQKNPMVAFGRVKVTVRTLDGTSERSGLQVWYVPVAWDGDSDHYKRFDNISSPTAQDLVAGAYQIWSVDPEKDKLGPKQPISVGETGMEEQKVDIPAPLP